MSKIKYINCIGTSFTAGGGFEWDSLKISRQNILKECYSDIDEPKTEYNFSFPGQLQKLLESKNIKVNNIAKSGYGVDRVFRKIFDIVNKPTFKTEETLFLIEFSQFERLEFYFKDLKSYIVGNYKFDNDGVTEINLAQTYWYDRYETIAKLDEFQPTLLEYLKNTFDYDQEFKRISRETSFFLSWLKQKNINVIFSSVPTIYSFKDIDLINSFPAVKYSDVESNIELPSIYQFISDNKLKIEYETNFVYNDFHAGYRGNKIISKLVYNSLIDNNFIEGEKFNIKQELKDYNIFLNDLKRLL